MRHSLDGVGASLRSTGNDGKQHRIGVARGLAVKLGSGWFGVPAGRELELNGPFGSGLRVHRHAHLERAAVERQDSRFRLTLTPMAGVTMSG